MCWAPSPISNLLDAIWKYPVRGNHPLFFLTAPANLLIQGTDDAPRNFISSSWCGGENVQGSPPLSPPLWADLFQEVFPKSFISLSPQIAPGFCCVSFRVAEALTLAWCVVMLIFPSSSAGGELRLSVQAPFPCLIVPLWLPYHGSQVAFLSFHHLPIQVTLFFLHLT